jgi:ParB family chromosome partitioning protein
MTTKRKVLGKGLDALLPSGPANGSPQQTDIDLLFPNPKQPRLRFTDESLGELAESIRENGIVQPIVVRGHGDRYEIVAGERRWRAAQKAGLTKVPIVVLDVPDDKMLELALLENIQREDLNPMEEARAYRLLTEEQGLRQEDLARRLGKGRTTITNSLRLLQLPEPVQQMLEERRLTPGQTRPLLGVADKLLQKRLAEVILQRGLSAREAERLVARLQKEKTRTRSKDRPDPHVLAAEEKLSNRLSTRVRIVSGTRGGQIVIHYTNPDELERLFELLSRLED